MIRSIEITNYKSILHEKVALRPLTVIVGTNGSGKSNLIEAIDFLASIARRGVAGAVHAMGGYSNLIPKAIPTSQASATRVSLSTSLVLPPPEGYPKDLPEIRVDHSIQIASSPPQGARVAAEKVVFHQVVPLGAIFLHQVQNKPIEESLLHVPSTFTLARGPRGGFDYQADPPLGTNMGCYLAWLGLPFISELKTETSLMRFLTALTVPSRPPGKKSRRRPPRQISFLDPDDRNVITFSSQAAVLRRVLGATRRYDLLLDELRNEQQVTSDRRVSTSGDNVPSVLRFVATDSDHQQAWRRILDTLRYVAPHVVSASPNSLRTGKEFVQFLENMVARPVESWESSDGTLRALAILLALETQPHSSTLLIEEPEQNLHPWAIRSLMDHVREVISDRDLQVVLATHSPQVLEALEPEEILVATRTPAEGSKFKTLSDVVPSARLVVGEAAQLWVKGLLGGIPGNAE
jgi:predicted ATPase